MNIMGLHQTLKNPYYKEWWFEMFKSLSLSFFWQFVHQHLTILHIMILSLESYNSSAVVRDKGCNHTVSAGIAPNIHCPQFAPMQQRELVSP